MTEVAFHFNVLDRTLHLCRLLRKVVGSGKRALVLLPTEHMAQVNQTLWAFSQEDFIAHASVQDALSVQQRSAVLLADAPVDPGHTQVLINTRPEMPQGFELFERVLELVGTQDEDKASARQRWRSYSQQGYAIQQHDLAKSKAQAA